MPKNAQGSWVGHQSQPVFQTYPTAGMLRPAAAPPQPATPPAVIQPPQVFTPPSVISPGTTGGGPIFNIPIGNVPGGSGDTTQVPDARTSLVNAVIRASGGSSRGRRSATRLV